VRVLFKWCKSVQSKWNVIFSGLKRLIGFGILFSENAVYCISMLQNCNILTTIKNQYFDYLLYNVFVSGNILFAVRRKNWSNGHRLWRFGLNIKKMSCESLFERNFLLFRGQAKIPVKIVLSCFSKSWEYLDNMRTQEYDRTANMIELEIVLSRWYCSISSCLDTWRKLPWNYTCLCYAPELQYFDDHKESMYQHMNKSPCV
jgi:hypothetical protein